MKAFWSGVVVAALGTWAALGCSDHAQTGDDQNVTSGACAVIAVKDGHQLTADELVKLNDPIANLILQGEGCPTTFAEIQAKLAKNDPCATNEEGLTTRLVTDRAQLLEHPDSYRAVVKRACQKRTDHELFMSIFGIGTQSDATGKVTDVRLPQATLELIGEQKTTAGTDGTGQPKVTSGVFNFYAREDNQWKFFGSSTDFLSQGYECNADGACIPKAATQQRCASCHVGGGLVMKELESPWVSWEGDRITPGAKDVIAKSPDLFGKQGNGVDLENSVEEGNQNDWVPTRVAFLKTLGLKEVLRPLFCSVDMNLQSQRQSLSGSDIFVDRIFSPGGGGTVKPDVYLKAIADSGQMVVDGRTGRQIIGGKDNKPIADTVFGFTYPMKSRQDSDYVQELQNQQVVDIDFIKDVLSIDFTRPLYSPTRCGLLDQLPDVPASEMQFEKVKSAVIAKLEGTQEPVAQKLLASLKDDGDAGGHDFEIKKFLDACAARAKAEPEAYAADVLRYASHLRKAARRARNAKNGGIIEFAETLPVDNLPEPTSGFDPLTCKLP
jgi:hypothetical protein